MNYSYHGILHQVVFHSVGAEGDIWWIYRYHDGCIMFECCKQHLLFFGGDGMEDNIFLFGYIMRI